MLDFGIEGEIIDNRDDTSIYGPVGLPRRQASERIVQVPRSEHWQPAAEHYHFNRVRCCLFLGCFVA